jgi:hypothetical protein
MRKLTSEMRFSPAIHNVSLSTARTGSHFFAFSAVIPFNPLIVIDHLICDNITKCVNLMQKVLRFFILAGNSHGNNRVFI